MAERSTRLASVACRSAGRTAFRHRPRMAQSCCTARLILGYNHLDTARIYGLGKNEELIGQTLKGRRNEFFLASKTGIIVDGEKRRIDCRPETIRAACEESLKLLQTDHIDLYYLHRRDFDTPIEESVGALAELVKAGKIGGHRPVRNVRRHAAPGICGSSHRRDADRIFFVDPQCRNRRARRLPRIGHDLRCIFSGWTRRIGKWCARHGGLFRKRPAPKHAALQCNQLAQKPCSDRRI